ncbi:MAG: hypothetical protein RL318_2399, partial [Fibrobacterota bacterium]
MRRRNRIAASTPGKDRLFPFSCGSIADRICLIHHFGKLMVRTF